MLRVVEVDGRPLHVDVGIAVDGDLGGGVQRDLGGVDDDRIPDHLDVRAALGVVDDLVVRHEERRRRGGRRRLARGRDHHRVRLPDDGRVDLPDLRRAVGSHDDAPVVARHLALVVADHLRVVPADGVGVVVLHELVQVLLGLHADELLAGRVLEHDLVVAAVGRGGVALPAALRLVGGQLVGRLLEVGVDAADDHRPVGIAAEEVDEHLLPDAREVRPAVARAAPGLAHGDPAGARLVHLALAVPVEADAHAAELVGVDLLPRGADDGGALDALHLGLRRRGARGGRAGPRCGRRRGARTRAFRTPSMRDSMTSRRLPSPSARFGWSRMLITMPGATSADVGDEGRRDRVAALGREALVGELLPLALVGAVLGPVVRVRRVAACRSRRGTRPACSGSARASPRRRGALRRRHELVRRGPPVVDVAHGVLARPHAPADAHRGHVLLVGDRGVSRNAIGGRRGGRSPAARPRGRACSRRPSGSK